MVTTTRGSTSARAASEHARPEAAQVAEFLRARRSKLKPEDLGLPSNGRRRTPGLRREEVAQLASISTTYYTFLEQGRDVRPSHQVIDALADALRLSKPERAHLVELVHGPASQPNRAADVLTPEVAAIVARLDPWPAYVTGRRWDVLASNKAARALWADWPALPPDERNMLWWTFMTPAARTVLVDWKTEAKAQLARFRMAAARHGDDTQFASLIARLQAGSAEIRKWWPQHEVTPLSSGTKRIHHRSTGVITFRHVVLQVADDPEQKLVTFTAGPDDEAALARLIGLQS